MGVAVVGRNEMKQEKRNKSKQLLETRRAVPSSFIRLPSSSSFATFAALFMQSINSSLASAAAAAVTGGNADLKK
jgi:hypothetical protein